MKPFEFSELTEFPEGQLELSTIIINLKATIKQLGLSIESLHSTNSYLLTKNKLLSEEVSKLTKVLAPCSCKEPSLLVTGPQVRCRVCEIVKDLSAILEPTSS